MIAARARREESRRQTELRLGVVPVVATDVVAGVGTAGHAALEIEEPSEPSVERIDAVKPALAADAIVHVHAEDDRVAGDDRRRLDLVAFAAEAAEPRRIETAGAGGEAPELDARARVERVEI